jgi:glycerol-3-phosphate dehydrogenase
MNGAWTADVALPGSEFVERGAARDGLLQRYRMVPPAIVRSVFRRHGSESAAVLGDGDVGEHFGGGLTEREVRYVCEHEWAISAEDVLWRRSKCGLHMTEAQRRRVAEAIGR